MLVVEVSRQLYAYASLMRIAFETLLFESASSVFHAGCRTTENVILSTSK